MKLISMTDFILEQNTILDKYINHEKAPLFDKSTKYASFLKQPLKLEMFTSEPIFENIKIDSYNKIFCGGYIGEIIRNKLFTQKNTIEDLTKNNVVILENVVKRIFG